MATNFTGFGLRVLSLGALLAALGFASATPAAAEFFGCNDKSGKALSSYNSAPRYAQPRAGTPQIQSRTPARTKSRAGTTRYTHELAAQTTRPRITIQPRQIGPGPNSKRICRSWLTTEHRVSGTVIVPQQQCWWQ